MKTENYARFYSTPFVYVYFVIKMFKQSKPCNVNIGYFKTMSNLI